ncbi:MAG TPA: TonB-dependent receptor [Bacteroidales bacterium]|nr:TonB-dependent receptor [Bacteroidales bacterium]
MRKFLLMLVLFSTGVVLFSQVTVVTGTVTSSEENLTIPGVSVIVKGTSLGVATNMDGGFTINVPEGSTTLVFSFLGMLTQEIEIEGRSTIDVVMEPDLMKVDEVLVVAYGSAKKSAFTGSASQVDSKKIESRPVGNFTTAIEGQAAGIQVTRASGQPGSSASIRIRGIGSINASNSPLYVVDGVPYSGNLASISSDDIESITILKDAASTALYGNKAANGVVLVTTKKGRPGEGRFNLKITQGITTRALPEYERMDAFQYYPVQWESLRNSYLTGGNDLATANQDATDDLLGLLRYNPFNVPDNAIMNTDGTLNSGAALKYDDLDWFEPLVKPGKRQEYNLSFDGGNETTDYYVSMGYLDESGWTAQSDYDRFSGRVQLNTRPRDWFKTGLNLNASIVESQTVPTGGTSYVNQFFFSRNIGPIYPVYVHDPVTGEYILDSNGKKIYDIGTGEYGTPTRGAGGMPGRHSVAETLWNDDLTQRKVIGAKTYLELSFLKDFKFTTNISVDVNNFNLRSYENTKVGDGAPAGRAERRNSVTTSVNINQLLNYNKSFGSHTISALVGHESYDYTYNYFRGFRQGQISEGSSELVNFTQTNSLTSYTDKYRTEGYLGRLDYDYDGKYFFTASYRRDGSSKFYTDVRWGDFWSLSAAWRLDQESFIRDLNWVNVFKLRGSYGQVGNDSGISDYAYQSLYSIYNNQTEPGFRQDTPSAYELQWESSNSFDIAVEFGLFSRIFGTVEFFHRISDNLLFAVPVPLSSGLSSIDMNIGTMYNQGIEFQVSGDVIQTSDFRWNINLVASTFKNEITKLPQEEIISGTKKLMVGHSIYDFWLREWYGVDPDNGDALYTAEDWDAATCQVIGADTLTTDYNNALFKYVGTSIPDLVGSITNSISFKGFELSAMLTYQLGGLVLDGTYAGYMSYNDFGGSMHVDLLDSWKQPGDVTDIPRIDNARSTQHNSTSSRWLTSANYLNIRSVTLSYNLPSSLLNTLDLGNVRIFLSGENLKMFNARKGLDTQGSFGGTTDNVYTAARIMTAGINVQF